MSLALVAVVAVFSAGFLLVPLAAAVPALGLRHMTSRPAPVGLECADEARS